MCFPFDPSMHGRGKAGFCMLSCGRHPIRGLACFCVTYIPAGAYLALIALKRRLNPPPPELSTPISHWHRNRHSNNSRKTPKMAFIGGGALAYLTKRTVSISAPPTSSTSTSTPTPTLSLATRTTRRRPAPKSRGGTSFWRTSKKVFKQAYGACGDSCSRRRPRSRAAIKNYGQTNPGRKY
ncbi:hypothetical protein FN846DRAFT_321349 [Sphaerosporella brunnea]|uniref:Uncharacterized protein n=1 Tax=Sphaerosporella brunnea TaxID=1250544 RepID=A0A5J5EKY7_9PEZI|nr:hypothetical protein FN846DRAFT_321349 [Sphaerosporella brunnea]